MTRRRDPARQEFHALALLETSISGDEGRKIGLGRHFPADPDDPFFIAESSEIEEGRRGKKEKKERHRLEVAVLPEWARGAPVISRRFLRLIRQRGLLEFFRHCFWV